MAYDIANIIINLKKQIDSMAGGGGTPVNITVLKDVRLREQTEINETLSHTVVNPAFLVVSLQAMTGSDITLSLNNVSLLYADGYRKVASGFFPVYPDDEISFSCESEGSDENLILSIALIEGIEVPTPEPDPEPEQNNNNNNERKVE